LGLLVIFGPASSGQLALVVYEWQDAKWLGINPSNKQAENSWQEDVSIFIYLPFPVHDHSIYFVSQFFREFMFAH
jgi:hypothetical protein